MAERGPFAVSTTSVSEDLPVTNLDRLAAQAGMDTHAAAMAAASAAEGRPARRARREAPESDAPAAGAPASPAGAHVTGAYAEELGAASDEGAVPAAQAERAAAGLGGAPPHGANKKQDVSQALLMLADSANLVEENGNRGMKRALNSLQQYVDPSKAAPTASPREPAPLASASVIAPPMLDARGSSEARLERRKRGLKSSMADAGAAATAATAAAEATVSFAVATAAAGGVLSPPPSPYPVPPLPRQGVVSAPDALDEPVPAGAGTVLATGTGTGLQAHVIKDGKRAGRTSQYRGVSFQNRYKHWEAQIKMNGRKQHLGYFLNEIDASKAYETALLKMRPEGARQFTSQYLGVNWNKHKAKWEVKVRVEGKQRHVGFFKDELEAANAYQLSVARVRRGEPYK
jgi:hypothetical protein